MDKRPGVSDNCSGDTESDEKTVELKSRVPIFADKSKGVREGGAREVWTD